ncbi:MAG: hypothetical protein ACK5NY_07000 [Burkholderiaceae bacterium]|jgi:hypothetical protein
MPDEANAAWVDPDDAPELTDEFFEKGTWRIGEQVVSREQAERMLFEAALLRSLDQAKASKIADVHTPQQIAARVGERFEE